MNTEHLDGWMVDYTKEFGNKFFEIAKLADNEDDEGYGKALAHLQIDIGNYIKFILTQQHNKTVMECLEKIKSQSEKMYPEFLERNCNDLLVILTDRILLEVGNGRTSN